MGNTYDKFVTKKLSSDHLPEGCIHDGDGIRIWVRTWADVLNDARARYEFFREKLEIEASHDHGLQRLRENHPHLLRGRGASKKVDLELSAKST